MEINSDNFALSGVGVKLELATEKSLPGAGEAKASTARYRCTKASISSRVGVGLCSSSFNLRRFGSPFMNCR